VTNHFEYNKRAKKLHEKDDLGKDSNDEWWLILVIYYNELAMAC
jgi:hypothetical protein